RRKRSPGKETFPGRKQVYRRYAADGRIESDVVTLVAEPRDGEPLLVPVLRQGRPVDRALGLARARERCAASLRTLPPGVESLDRRAEFSATIDPCVLQLA